MSKDVVHISAAGERLIGSGEKLLDRVVVRPAEPSDRPKLIRAVAELRDYERELHETRLPGQRIADAYTRWMLSSAAGGDGLLVLVAQDRNEFVGFAAGWIEHEENVAQTSDSNRFGFISDICILSKYRGMRIANELLDAIISHFDSAGIKRVRIGVLAANRSAKLAYERAGFQPYEMATRKSSENRVAPRKIVVSSTIGSFTLL